MKKVAMLFVCGLLMAVCVSLVACGQAQSKAKFEEVYNMIVEKHGQNPCFKLGSDGSYLEVDTDPLDTGGKEGYNGLGPIIISKYWEVVEDVNNALGLPGYIYQSMKTTTWSQGKQTATANGITVTWTYHPTKGLEAMYIMSK